MAIDQGVDVVVQQAALQERLEEQFGDILYANQETWPDLKATKWWWLDDDVDGLDSRRIEIAQSQFGMRNVIIGDHWDEEAGLPVPQPSRRGIYVHDPFAPLPGDSGHPNARTAYIQVQRELFRQEAGEVFTPKLEESAEALALERYNRWFLGFVAELGSLDSHSVTVRMGEAWDMLAGNGDDGASLDELRRLVTDIDQHLVL